MTIFNGKDGAFESDDTVVENLTVTNWSLETSVNTAPTTGLGDANENYDEGLQAATATVEAFAVKDGDITADADMSLVAGSTMQLELSPDGTDAFQASFLCTGVTEEMPRDDKAKLTLEFTLNDASGITFGTMSL